MKYVIKQEIVYQDKAETEMYIGYKKATCQVSKDSETFKAFVREYGFTDKNNADDCRGINELVLNGASRKCSWGTHYRLTLIEVEDD